MVIGMDAKCSLLHYFTKTKKRLVLITFAFRDDDRPFRSNFIWIETTVHHAIRFQTQGEIYLISGHGFKIGSPINVGKSIPTSAFTRDGFVQNIRRELISAFKLHMFDPVRNSCSSLYFIRSEERRVGKESWCRVSES